MQIVKVRLRKPSHIHAALCEELELDSGDPCIVRTDRGLEYGCCVVPPKPCEEEPKPPIELRVIRKATGRDEEKRLIALEDENKGREVCLRQIESHGLPMKLVDVEYTFDRRKVVFYFTAEDRVDFRELVRDLAHELKTRIELCHIQVRDEAKVVGGIGPCGLELCCKLWLQDFIPISMKMAKRQNLSLNPEKISGQCGRLLCCLSYENDQYEDRKKVKKKLVPEPTPAKQAPDTAQSDKPTPSSDPKNQPRPEGESRPKRRRRKPKTADASTQKPQEQAASGAPQGSDDKSRTPRKRRRRRRGKKPGGGGQGGQSGAPPAKSE